MMRISSLRTLIVFVILAVATHIAYFSLARLNEMPLRKPLTEIPGVLGQWNKTGQISLDDKIVDMLGVDDYVERVYMSRGPENQYVDLYVSYFNVLKEGKQFHSPKNCLIGSGSSMLKRDTVSIPVHDSRGSVKVSYLLLQKGDHKQLILYWFQGRGRIMHSEYEERIYRVLDAIFNKRTEGAFVRITSTDRGNNIDETFSGLVDFSSRIIPVLDEHFP